MDPAAAASSATNCRSVASSAPSGMLLTRPIVIQLVSGSRSAASASRRRRSMVPFRSDVEASGSSDTGIRLLQGSARGDSRGGTRLVGRESRQAILVRGEPRGAVLLRGEPRGAVLLRGEPRGAVL